MKKIRVVTKEDRGNGDDVQIHIFEKEANARACFKLLCDDTKNDFSEGYIIEERENYLYVDDVYIYVEIFETSFDDEDRESGDLYSNIR